jgi:hypothetical protein
MGKRPGKNIKIIRAVCLVLQYHPRASESSMIHWLTFDGLGESGP